MVLVLILKILMVSIIDEDKMMIDISMMLILDYIIYNIQFQGFTALKICAWKKFADGIKILHQHGASINIQNEDGKYH